MARTSNLANVATVSRATKAWYPGGWDFTNGGAITGSLTEYANDTARDGAQGLLVEESSTNEIVNPRFEGGAAGSPGTLPSSFSLLATGFTREAIAFGKENGWDYFEVRLTGNGTSPIIFFLNSGTDVPASDGQSWTTSFGARIVAGDLTNITDMRIRLDERDASSIVQSDISPAIQLDSAHRRYFYSPTLSGGGSVTIIRPLLLLNTTGAIDITLRIYAPQLEEKAYPTSPILPPASSPAASTRNADDIEVANGAWASNNALTLFADLATTNVASTAVYAVAASADLSNFVSFGQTGGGKHWARLVEGVATGQNNQADVVVGQPILLAAAAKSGDSALSVTGSTQTTSTVAIEVSDYDKLTLGSIRSSLHANCYIRQIRYWPRRLTNAELEALVGN